MAYQLTGFYLAVPQSSAYLSDLDLLPNQVCLPSVLLTYLPGSASSPAYLILSCGLIDFAISAWHVLAATLRSYLTTKSLPIDLTNFQKYPKGLIDTALTHMAPCYPGGLTTMDPTIPVPLEFSCPTERTAIALTQALLHLP